MTAIDSTAGLFEGLPSIWDVLRWAAGEEGVARALAAWMFLIGLVIVSAAFGAIATPILVTLGLIAVVGVLLWGLFKLMSDAEIAGIDGKLLFTVLAAGGAVVAGIAGSFGIAVLLSIVAVGVIIA